MRLAKYMAGAGVASRRGAEAIVREGRVCVNGETVLDPARDVGAEDAVTLDGTALRPEGSCAVYVLNKPAGVVSTASDPQGRPTVVSLVETELRLYPVGRLDIDTTGLILLTNDGQLAYRLTHPSFEVTKTYRVRVRRPPIDDAALAALRTGVTLEDGVTAPAQVRRVAPDVLELTIHEGRKRQVRRMCEAVGHRVESLERIAFGPLQLGALAPGRHRQLSAGEIQALAAAAAPQRGG